ncbi:hypothetical protein [Streptomyces galilaeus]|uniref:hypothetical protein n=1 Tax=Streptomyces galilaeus TaxID=33899 RepID=UPI003570B47B
MSRAIDMYEQTLADRARVLGEDDPDTLFSRNNLASANQEAGACSGLSPCTSGPSPTACE